MPAPSPAPSTRIAFLSPSDLASNAKRIERLHETFARAGINAGSVQVEHHQVPQDAAKRDAMVARLLQDATRYTAVMATTMLLAQSAQRASSTVPIVFDGAGNPMRFCLVDSMTRPGRNATGRTTWLPAEPKMLEALLDSFPTVEHAIVLLDGNETSPPCGSAYRDSSTATQAACAAGLHDSPAVPLGRAALQAVAAQRGVKVFALQLCGPADFALVAEAARNLRHVGFVVPLHYLFYEQQSRLVALITSLQVPAIYPRGYFLDDGGAVSLSPMNDRVKDRRSFEILAEVILGRSPATIPVEVPMGFELTISVEGARRASLRPSRLALRRAQDMRP